MPDRKPALPLDRFRDAAGDPLVGWRPAPHGRRTAAWAIDVALILGTAGVGYLLWAFRLWEAGTTPGKRALGLTVFATDTRRPADRNRMVLRAFVHRMWGRAMGISTLGLGFFYVWGAAAGRTRRTLYDDWAQTVVLAGPRPAVLRS